MVCEHIGVLRRPQRGATTEEMKQRLAHVSPAPLISSRVFAGVLAAADGTGGAAVRSSASSVAATTSRYYNLLARIITACFVLIIV